MIPRLETERLILRGHRREDYADCAAMWADPVVTRHIGGRPFSGEEVWTRLLRYIGHWEVLGFGYWIMHDHAGQFVGEIGFADFRREIDPPLNAPEIGWALATSAHGRGLATEAVRAVLTWGDAHLPSRRSVCLIDPDNTASIRVAQKCGYSEWIRTHYKGSPTILYERQ